MSRLAQQRDDASIHVAGACSRAPAIEAPDLASNTRLKMDGLEFLSKIPSNVIPAAFLDPQYRGVLDKRAYGNEGKKRGQKRAALMQMPDDIIGRFNRGMGRVLLPSGHLFLWVDKFHLCEGVGPWLENTHLDIVDLVTWNRGTLGMGYRTRRRRESCIVLQREPRRAKGVRTVHNIPDVVCE